MPAILRRGEIVRIRDERWRVCRRVDHGAVVSVDVRGCDRSNRGTRARFLLPFDTVERLPAVPAMRVVGRRRWRHLARRTLAAAVPQYDSLRTAAAARIDILPFQLEPALAVIGGSARRVLIADEVGLGKTVQAGLIAAETLERDADARVLVVCPASLREQWCSELSARFDLDAAILDSGSLARPDLAMTPGANPWAAHRLIVTSMDFVKRPEVLRALESLVWDFLVIDEAHRVAGASDRHGAAAMLGNRARTLALLTATPHSGDEDGFERLCGIGRLDAEFPLAVFRRTRREAGLAASRRTTWLAVSTTPAERAMHDALAGYARLVWRQRASSSGARLAMIVLLRRACSSAAAVARSIERRLMLLAGHGDDDVQLGLPFDDESSDEEPLAALRAPGLPDAARERRLLAGILSLAREARGRDSKAGAVRRLLRRTGERAIVFTEYRDTLADLAASLEPFGGVELHGGLGPVERRQALERFVSGASRLLLATDAASEGLNLQHHCRLVIHLELPWNPIRIEQRVGRVDRIGQRRRVHQLLLMASGTSEQSIVAMHVQGRAARVAQTLAAMRPEGGDEHTIAERIVGIVPSRCEAAAAPLPDGVFIPDVRDRACAEAIRCSAARRLDSARARPDLGTRPFATAVPNAVRAYWAFTLAHVPAADDVLWEILVGVGCRLDCRDCSRDRQSLRGHLDAHRRLLTPHVERAAAGLLAESMAAVERATVQAIAREQAIATELARRNARLAAALVQRALFDRHAERRTAVQRDELQQAMTRCQERLARLRRRLDSRAVEIEPAFAAILR